MLLAAYDELHEAASRTAPGDRRARGVGLGRRRRPASASRLSDDHVHWFHQATDDELAALYRHVFVVVIPSLEEGYGLPLAEALGVGAVVGTGSRGPAHCPRSGASTPSTSIRVGPTSWQPGWNATSPTPNITRRDGPRPRGSSASRWDDVVAEVGQAVVSAVGRIVVVNRRLRVVVATADSITERWPARPSGRGTWPRSCRRPRGAPGHDQPAARTPRVLGEVVRHQDVTDLVEWCDVFVFQGWVMAGPRASSAPTRSSSPTSTTRSTSSSSSRPATTAARPAAGAVRDAGAVLNEQLARGDFFLCRQREAARPLARPPRRDRTDQPRDLRRRPRARVLIDVVPFGIPDHPPERTRPGSVASSTGSAPTTGSCLGRRRLQLVRPGDADRAVHQLPSGPRRAARCSWACATRTPTPRDACGRR